MRTVRRLIDKLEKDGLVGLTQTDLFSTLPGYTGSNVRERPEEAEKEACLTLRELEQRLVGSLHRQYL